VKLSDLTQFVVESIRLDGDRALVSGRLNDLKQVRDFDEKPLRSRGWLYTSGTDSPIGDLVRSTPGLDAVFECDANKVQGISEGASFPWIDGVWNARDVAKILDTSHHWARTEFTPVDAVGSKADGWFVTKKTDGPTSTEDIIKGGWDHEHCKLCTNNVGIGGDAFGYVDEDDYWICELCYNKYAKANDVAFLVEL
jgi:hypothetical protein